MPLDHACLSCSLVMIVGHAVGNARWPCVLAMLVGYDVLIMLGARARRLHMLGRHVRWQYEAAMRGGHA